MGWQIALNKKSCSKPKRNVLGEKRSPKFWIYVGPHKEVLAGPIHHPWKSPGHAVPLIGITVAPYWFHCAPFMYRTGGNTALSVYMMYYV